MPSLHNYFKTNEKPASSGSYDENFSSATLSDPGKSSISSSKKSEQSVKRRAASLKGQPYEQLYFYNGKIVECPVCGMTYNTSLKSDLKTHQTFHDAYLAET